MILRRIVGLYMATIGLYGLAAWPLVWLGALELPEDPNGRAFVAFLTVLAIIAMIVGIKLMFTKEDDH